MGKAHCNPAWTTEQCYYVTHHALDRLRERSKPAGHLEDMALARVVDDALQHALRDEANVFDVTDQGEEAKLVRVAGESLDGLTLKGAFFVLLKPNSREDSQYKEAVITVLTESMARKHYSIDVKDEGFGNPLAAKLLAANIQTASPPKIPGPTPAPKPTEPEPEYLVIDGADGTIALRGTKDQATSYMLEHPTAQVEVLRCYPVKVRVKVELEG